MIITADSSLITADAITVTADGLYQSLVSAFTGGLPPKKAKSQIKKNQRDEVEAIVRAAFDQMDEVNAPPEMVVQVQKTVKKEIKQIDLGQYDDAIAQINALLLSAKLKIQEYESELEDEHALLLLL